MKFYSIPGVSPYNSKSLDVGAPIGENPRAAEFYAGRRARGDVAHTAGFTAGDRISINGRSAVVELEDRDNHTGTITTVSRTDRASYVSRWKQSGVGELVMTEAKRSFD